MAKLKRWSQSPMALLTCVLVCEIVGGALLLGTGALSLVYPADEIAQVRWYGVAMALGSIVLSVVFPKLLRARAKKYGAVLY